MDISPRILISFRLKLSLHLLPTCIFIFTPLFPQYCLTEAQGEAAELLLLGDKIKIIIKTMKRMTCGFRNMEFFKQIIFLGTVFLNGHKRFDIIVLSRFWE